MKVKTYYAERPEELSFYPSGDGTTVRFRENITEEEEGWSADEYSVFIRCDAAAARARVEKNTAAWLAKAKANAADPAPTQAEIIQAQLDEQADALIELAALIVGGE